MTIEQRMELLECTNRRWRRLACTMAVLIVAAVGIGATQMNEMAEQEKTRQAFRDIAERVRKQYPTPVERAERNRLRKEKLEDAMLAQANELTPAEQLTALKVQEKALDIRAKKLLHGEAAGLAARFSKRTGRKITEEMVLNHFPEVMEIMKQLGSVRRR